MQLILFLLSLSILFINQCFGANFHELNSVPFQAITSNQSPINLNQNLLLYTYSNSIYIADTKYENLTNPIIYYSSSMKKLSTASDVPLGYINVMIKDNQYKYLAKELRFFLPSEHQFDKQHAQIEMQIVHKLETSVASSELLSNNLIISIFFLSRDTYTNDFIRSFLNFRDETSDDNLFHESNETPPTIKPPINEHSIANINKLVQKNKMYYYYKESTTLTPYDEDTSFFILNYFYYFSESQLNQFKKIVKKFYSPNENNNRDIQDNKNIVYLLYNNSISINIVFSYEDYTKISYYIILLCGLIILYD